MLEGIEVTKAGTPDQDGDVLGGTVNFILKSKTRFTWKCYCAGYLQWSR